MKMPSAWGPLPTNNAKDAKVEAANKVTARIDMSEEVAGAGLCPDCKQPMGKSIASNVEVRACHPCRIAIPLPDAEMSTEEEVPLML